ncbi:pantoate--beta-alanine ligase [Zavarzinella formosa]|uniref:pantoate--beta-alanine ligase n=1 Tax=Zavarzinella formosa TaxID=360055 RepID=UPI0002F6236F|nr:pantoate--beta-alanine ligase [Zavarzinella formosa]
MLTPVVPSIAEVRQLVREARQAGRRVGFVPTMGALHAGHAALIRQARLETDFVVVSIFVNPTQFGPTEDFGKYPRTLEDDRQLCTAVGTDLIFAPDAATMYPPDASTFVEVPALQTGLCGDRRPGHFRGVATVVLKLFNIVAPDVAYFGQKDYQQARLLQQMAEDLNVPTQVVMCPTVRESDGLAMSSRNRYLSPVERGHAVCLIQSLEHAKLMLAAGERHVNLLVRGMVDILEQTPGARIDYVEIRDAKTLQPIGVVERPAVAALAVFLGTTRLIDNLILNP